MGPTAHLQPTHASPDSLHGQFCGELLLVCSSKQYVKRSFPAIKLLRTNAQMHLYNLFLLFLHTSSMHESKSSSFRDQKQHGERKHWQRCANDDDFCILATSSTSSGLNGESAWIFGYFSWSMMQLPQAKPMSVKTLNCSSAKRKKNML